MSQKSLQNFPDNKKNHKKVFQKIPAIKSSSNKQVKSQKKMRLQMWILCRKNNFRKNLKGKIDFIGIF